MAKYLKRIVDKELTFKLKTFGATCIVGPKWCGKTTTAEQFSNSALKLQSVADKEGLLQTAKINPSVLLQGEKPRLIDEWQDAPKLWDAVRASCDDNNQKGQYILTGSTSQKVEVSHTGTGRISRLKMYPMSLFESGESNGTVSLSKIFEEGPEKFESCVSDLTIERLIFAACRGGWPGSLTLSSDKSQLAVSKDYFQQIIESDMFSVDKVKRNKSTMRAVLQSYARNISTLAKGSNIVADVSATNSITAKTLDDYISVLEELFIVEDLYGWCPEIRSKTAMRSGRKREFIDPSLVVAALGGSPQIYNFDLKTFGFIFECLCIRDLRIYSSAFNATLSYYHDRSGLESDVVLHLADGRFALIEIKLGSHDVEEGAKHLCKIDRLIDDFNRKNPSRKMRKPDLKIVLTGTKYGYKTEEDVLVIPIGCLKD